MIISRTPFRITFVGGGTDLREFYQNESGLVINATINKYMYITVNKMFGNSVRVAYSKTEEVEDVEQIQHPVVREALKYLGIKNAINITTMADIPAKGTGLGSSSSFTVGLLNCLYAYLGKHCSARKLAEEACLIEREILKEAGGKQDQYAAAYGGINAMEFKPDEGVFVKPTVLSKKVRKELEDNLILFYTGITRSSLPISEEQKRETKNKMHVLREMKRIAEETRDALMNDDLTRFGDMLHKNWVLKSSITGAITNELIDSYYKKAREAGAIGGKLVGAGGGGFLLIYAKKEAHPQIMHALKELKTTEFSFEPEGSKIIYVSD